MPAPTLTLALAQRTPLRGDVGAAARRHAADVLEAAGRGARLVVFPELSLTGYDLAPLAATTHDPLAGGSPWCVPDDARLDPVRDTCARTGTVALVGAGVAAGDARLIASLRVDPDGSVAVHAKSHLHGAEHGVAQPVPPGGPFELDGWRVAVAVCFDLATPSHAAAAAAHDADLYVASVLYDVGDERRFDLHGGARALDHRMVVAAANSVGPWPGGVACGASAVWGPDGSVPGRAGAGEELLVVTVAREPGERLRAQDRAHRSPAPSGTVAALS